MATIAEQLIGGAQRTAEGLGKPIGEGLTQLGQNIQRTQENRQKLEAQKQQLQEKKIGRFAQAVQAGSRLKDSGARNSFFKKFLPQLRSGLGLDDQFSDQSLQMLSTSPDLQQKFDALVSQVQQGQISSQEAQAIFNDPEQLANLGGDKLLAAEQFALTKEAQAASSASRLALAGQAAGVRQVQTTFKNTSALRRELRKDEVTKATIKINASFDKVRSALGEGDPSAAGDMAAIFAFMKILDPESTVREGEFASAQNAAGVPDRIVNFYNRAAKGELLNPNQRKDFLGVAEGILAGQLKRQDTVNDRFRELAKRSGLDPEQVILTEGVPKASVFDTFPKLNAKSFAGLSDKAKQQLATESGLSLEEIEKELGAK